MDPTKNNRKRTRRVCPIIGSLISFAKGDPTGIRVNVSLIVGTHDKKKLNDKRKFSKYLALRVALLRRYNQKAIISRKTINRENICPGLNPPCFDIPKDVNDVISVA